MQTQQEIDTLIANELEEGERVLWTDRPHPSSRVSTSPTRVFYILAIFYGTIGLILLVVGFILALTLISRVGNGASLGLFITGGIFAVLAIVFGLVATLYRPNLKGTVYAITEQRIITVTIGKSLIVYSYGKNDIGALNRIEQPDGIGDLIYSLNRQASPYGAQGYGSYGGYGNSTTGSTLGMLRAATNAGKLLGVSNVREVEHIVRRTFKYME